LDNKVIVILFSSGPSVTQRDRNTRPGYSHSLQQIFHFISQSSFNH